MFKWKTCGEELEFRYKFTDLNLHLLCTIKKDKNMYSWYICLYNRFENSLQCGSIQTYDIFKGWSDIYFLTQEEAKLHCEKKVEEILNNIRIK
jgi:hypothetical protein